MKQKIVITVSLLFCVCTIGFTACQKIETGKNTPQCIKKKIKKDPKIYCLSLVTEYIYIPQETNKIQNRIYKFSYGSPACWADAPIPPIYYDEQCNIIDVIVDKNYYIKYDNFVYQSNRYVYQYYDKK